MKETENDSFGLFDDTHSLTNGGPQTVATATALFSSLTDTETALLPDLLTRSVRRDERLASDDEYASMPRVPRGRPVCGGSLRSGTRGNG